METIFKFIEIMTSGRISSDSIQPLMFLEIFQKSPFIGIGYGTVKTTDMGFLEIFIISGLLGLILYLLIFVVILLKKLLIFLNHLKKREYI